MEAGIIVFVLKFQSLNAPDPWANGMRVKTFYAGRIARVGASVCCVE